MKASKRKKKPTNCPSCGAPATTEFCPYCGVATGLKSSEANMEYPVLDCDEIILNRSDIKFVVTMGIGFALIGLFLLFLFVYLLKYDGIFMYIMSVPYILFGIGLMFSPLVKVFRFLRAKVFGKKIEATVYGYLDDDVLINNRPGQIAKLLIQTPEGPCFLLYQLENTLRPYGVHSTVDMLAYKDEYVILGKKYPDRS